MSDALPLQLPEGFQQDGEPGSFTEKLLPKLLEYHSWKLEQVPNEPWYLLPRRCYTEYEQPILSWLFGKTEVVIFYFSFVQHVDAAGVLKQSSSGADYDCTYVFKSNCSLASQLRQFHQHIKRDVIRRKRG